MERLLPRYWQQAQAESSIDPLLPPEVDEVTELLPGEPLTFIATVETRPQIELRNIDGLRPARPVGRARHAGDRGDASRTCASRVSDWITVERPAARGDLVEPGRSPTLGSTEHGRRSEHRHRSTSRSATHRSGRSSRSPSPACRPARRTTFTRRHEHPPAEEGGAPEVHEQKFQRQGRRGQGARPAAARRRLRRQGEPRVPDASRSCARRSPGGCAASKERAAPRGAPPRPARPAPRPPPPRAAAGGGAPGGRGLVQDYAESLARRGVDIEQGRHRLEPPGQGDAAARREAGARAAAARRHRRRRSLQVSEEEFERALAVFARAQKISTPVLRRTLDEDGRLANLRSQLRRDKTIRSLLGEAGAKPALRDRASAQTAIGSVKERLEAC